MSFSKYLEDKMMQHAFCGVQYTVPQTLYLALYVSNPTDNDTGTEVNGAGYARVPITFNTPTVSGQKTVIANALQITLAQATADWGTVTHYGIRDAATGGNLLAYSSLAISKSIQTGDQPEFPVGGITVSID